MITTQYGVVIIIFPHFLTRYLTMLQGFDEYWREYEIVVNENDLVILNGLYYCRDDGRLSNNSFEYYLLLRTHYLYEALTRVKKSSHLVIINNSSLYIQIQHILALKNDKLYSGS